MTEPLLAILPSVAFVDDGARVLMDVKATEGLMQYAALWPGRVQCYMPRGAEANMSFGQWYDRKDLPFDVIAKPADAHALGQLLRRPRLSSSLPTSTIISTLTGFATRRSCLSSNIRPRHAARSSD